MDFKIFFFYEPHSGHAVASYLRHFATNWKVAVSISDGVIGIFHRHNLSDRTQPLTEMSTRYISLGVKAAGV